MYRIAAALAVLMLFAACHSDGVGMEWDAGLDPSVSGQTQMEELTVEWLGTDTAIHKEKKVTVDAARGISVEISVIGTEGAVTNSCSGAAEMTEEDYQTVVTQVMAADLPNYEPPVEGDEDCTVTEGLLGMVITYSYKGEATAPSESEDEAEEDDGIEVTKNTEDAEEADDTDDAEEAAGVTEVSFETGKCAMESKIQAVVTVVEGLAKNYITDCTDEIVAGGGATTETEDADADESETDVDDNDVEPGTGPETDSSDDNSDNYEADKPVFKPVHYVE